MEIAIPYKPNPLISSSPTNLLKRPKSSGLVPFPTKYGQHRVTSKNPIFRVYASQSSNGSSSNNGGGFSFSWLRLTQSLRLGVERIGESVKKETGFDSEEAGARVDEYVGRVKDSVKKGQGELTRFRTETVPSFIDWNKWEHWKVSCSSSLLIFFDVVAFV